MSIITEFKDIYLWIFHELQSAFNSPPKSALGDAADVKVVQFG